jgi:sigma-B regulation protein RsbU (phosphoserine phosphatase)
MHILVVDDSEDGRDIAEAVLLAAGYRDVSTVGSAADAFALLAMDGQATVETSPVDLVLLDIIMPEIDGIEACARIHSDPRYSDIPIIMVTLLADMDSLANAFVAGATDYITKPLNRVEPLAAFARRSSSSPSSTVAKRASASCSIFCRAGATVAPRYGSMT